VFADAGSVWDGGNVPALPQSFTVGSADVMRSSVGARLIWGSPFGPIRVDYRIGANPEGAVGYVGRPRWRS
jgi:outer membrane protein insertion porin family